MGRILPARRVARAHIHCAIDVYVCSLAALAHRGSDTLLRTRSLTQPGAAVEQCRMYALEQDLCCPITLEVMRDPVVADDGHSYEREAIECWLIGNRTSPVTRRVMGTASLIPNHRLRTLIQDLQGNPTGDAPRGPVANVLGAGARVESISYTAYRHALGRAKAMHSLACRDLLRAKAKAKNKRMKNQLQKAEMKAIQLYVRGELSNDPAVKASHFPAVKAIDAIDRNCQFGVLPLYLTGEHIICEVDRNETWEIHREDAEAEIARGNLAVMSDEEATEKLAAGRVCHLIRSNAPSSYALNDLPIVYYKPAGIYARIEEQVGENAVYKMLRRLVAYHYSKRINWKWRENFTQYEEFVQDGIIVDEQNSDASDEED